MPTNAWRFVGIVVWLVFFVNLPTHFSPPPPLRAPPTTTSSARALPPSGTTEHRPPSCMFRGVTPLMYLMQAMRPDDDRGEEAMANVLAVINKASWRSRCGFYSAFSLGLALLLRFLVLWYLVGIILLFFSCLFFYRCLQRTWYVLCLTRFFYRGERPRKTPPFVVMTYDMI